MLTTGIIVSNQFSLESIGSQYYKAYLFMGVLDVLTLGAFLFIFKTHPFEEDIENDNEARLVENL